MDIKNSIDSVLKDRLTSPFWGTFTLTWLVWNWKAWYVTLFEDTKSLGGISKTQYLLENCSSHLSLWLGPLASTILLLTLFQYVPLYADKINSYFKKKKRDNRLNYQRDTLLTVQESAKLLDKVLTQDALYNKLIIDNANMVRSLQEHSEALEKDLFKKAEELSNLRKDSAIQIEALRREIVRINVKDFTDPTLTEYRRDKIVEFLKNEPAFRDAFIEILIYNSKLISGKLMASAPAIITEIREYFREEGLFGGETGFLPTLRAKHIYRLLVDEGLFGTPPVYDIKF